MANDKFKDLTPVTVDFVEGERPTEVKLDGAFNQLIVGLEELEFLMGDPYGFSGNIPYNFTNNFARDIGNRDLLSPRHQPDVSLTNYTQTLTVNQSEHELDLIPVGTGAAIINSSTDASVIPAQFKASPDLLDTLGDWTLVVGLNEAGLQKNSRKLVTFAPSDGGTVEFAQVTTGHGDTYVGGTWNVMPSQAQVDAAGATVDVVVLDAVNNIYQLTLPTNDTYLNRLGSSGSATLSNTTAVGGGEQLVLPPYFFDPGGLDLETNDGGSGLGKVFPLGLVRVWDWDTGQIVEGLLEVKGSDLFAERRYRIICTFQAGVLLSPTGRYSVIVSGTGLAEIVDRLRTELYNHTHDGDDLIRHIDHASLMGLRTGGDISQVGQWYGASNIDNNDHSMYLHRNGLDLGDTGGGFNIMRGDLVIGSTDQSGTAPHYNTDFDSFELYFGSNSGPSIFFDKEQSLSIPAGAHGNLPASFLDEVLHLVGASNGSLLTTYIEGNLWVEDDVVLGTNEDSDVVVQGDIYVDRGMILLPRAHSGSPETGRIEYLTTNNRGPEVWDGNRWTSLVYGKYDAVVGNATSIGVTHTSLDLAFASLSAAGGGRILIVDDYVLPAPIQVSGSNILVEGLHPGIVIDGTSLAAATVGITANAQKLCFRDLTFNGFGSKTALQFTSLAGGFRVTDCWFGTGNTTDINVDPSLATYVIANNMSF